jgi:hypothetical protein
MPSILSVELPRDHEARLARLRSEAARLPLLDRYLAGEHEAVWNDLASLKAKVRSPDHAADALAVAYETMHRVDRNVAILTGRLGEMGYSFVQPGEGGGLLDSLFGRKPKGHDPHVRPGPDTWVSILEVEETIEGPLPLSLRAFYDVVGEVNLNGCHEAINPPGEDVLADPLMVYGAEDALGWLGSTDFEDQDMVIAIAPDDLHKANISGSGPYVVPVPSSGADVRLIDSPYETAFVDYLRLAFQWGGFPGWKAAKAAPPAELARLREGLLPF